MFFVNLDLSSESVVVCKTISFYKEYRSRVLAFVVYSILHYSSVIYYLPWASTMLGTGNIV